MTTTDEILRPQPPAVNSLKSRLVTWGLARMDLGFRILRNLCPILRFGKLAVVTRFDDVQEVFSRHEEFLTPYNSKLDVIMGGVPFFLGMHDTPAYTRDTSNMRVVARRTDITPRLSTQTEARGKELVDAAKGRIDVVDMVRTITFDVLCDYFGTPKPTDGDLRVWATRLFEFQFADGANDPALRVDVDRFAPLLRNYLDQVIQSKTKEPGSDDLLSRCLALHSLGTPGMDLETIRTNFVGFIVGGLPQPPIVVPQAMEQLLLRPAALAEAIAAAQKNDDVRLAALVFEAMRFDPIAPGLGRVAAQDYVLAAGALRARKIPKDTYVFTALRSAVRDGRRVPHPERFDASRPAYQYMHFGYGMHSCFFTHVNAVLLPLMLKPLLRQGNIRRAEGKDGVLTKRGIFPERLIVTFG